MKRILLLAIAFIGINAQDISDWSQSSRDTVRKLEAFVEPVQEYRRVKHAMQNEAQKLNFYNSEFIQLGLGYGILTAQPKVVDYTRYKCESFLTWQQDGVQVNFSEKDKYYNFKNLWQLSFDYQQYMQENVYSAQKNKYAEKKAALKDILSMLREKSYGNYECRMPVINECPRISDLYY